MAQGAIAHRPAVHYKLAMSDLSDIITAADLLMRVRNLFAVIRREAGMAGWVEIEGIAEEAEAVTAKMIRREAN